MKSYKIIFSIYAVCFITFFAQAQDTLVLKNNQMVIGKIMEMDQSGVKIKSVFGTQLEIRTYPTMDISSIKYEDTAAANPKSTPQSAKHRRHAIRVDLLPLAANHLDFAYETNLMQPISYQVTLGIIGVGTSNSIYTSSLSVIEQKGAFLTIGAKFSTAGTKNERRKSRYKREDESDDASFLEPGFVKAARLMKKNGWYAMPELTGGSYNQTTIKKFPFPIESPRINENIQFARIGLRGGTQWLFSNRFTICVELGLSYCFDNSKSTDDFGGIPFFMSNTLQSGLHTNAGIGFGFAF